MEKVTISVVKPFVFSTPPAEGRRVAQDRKFMPRKDKEGKYIPTEFEVDASMLEHPWIKEDHADGCIETREQIATRLAATAKASADKSQDDAKVLAQAEAAMRRATGASIAQAGSKEEQERELNTPVDKLGKNQGKDIDKK